MFDIRKLYADTGMFTYDPGFMSTASCQSRITYIDGEKGILLYRGYAIEDLAEHSSFTEVAYLLFYGELPTTRELSDFNLLITRHTMIHEQLTRLFQGFRRDAHPMAILVGVVGALSALPITTTTTSMTPGSGYPPPSDSSPRSRRSRRWRTSTPSDSPSFTPGTTSRMPRIFCT